VTDDGYVETLKALRDRVHEARAEAAKAVNRAQNQMYWDIGHIILTRQAAEGWGANVVGRLADDLKAEFSDMGWSRTTLMYCRKLAELFPDRVSFVQQAVGQMPWGSVVLLLNKHGDDSATLTWYAKQTVDRHLSRKALSELVASRAHERQGAAQSNFHEVLPADHAAVIQETLLEPTTLGFLGLTDAVAERTLEQHLVAEVQSFMENFGYGLAFIRRQHHVEVGGEDFYIDLLFYNYEGHCFVVVELKVEDFKPEFAGKLNLYINAVEAKHRGPDDNETIGVILVPGKNPEIVAHSLKGAHPMAVVTYTYDQVPAAQQLISRRALPAAELPDVG
jgi:predicted nuclease of restriction endonuclease-like (RecB) superfamily